MAYTNEIERSSILLVRPGGGDSQILQAIRDNCTACVVVTADSYDRALEYLSRAGEPVARTGSEPSLVLLEADASAGALDFIRQAKSIDGGSPCPVVVLCDEAEDRALEHWYEAGANSVLSFDGEGPAEIAKSVSWYWLKHNRTPKLR